MMQKALPGKTWPAHEGTADFAAAQSLQSQPDCDTSSCVVIANWSQLAFLHPVFATHLQSCSNTYCFR